jgi:hypothetical protein
MLLAVIGGLQLALAHPKNVGKSSEMMRSFIEQLTPRLTEIDAVYKVLIDAGFNRNQDQ